MLTSHESKTVLAAPNNGVVDLSNCAKEPIHMPGLIQPHGLLLVLDEAGEMIRQASENALELVGARSAELVDHPLEALLGHNQMAHLKMILRGDELIRANPLELRLPDGPGGRAFNVLIHVVNTELVLEAEPIEYEDIGIFQSFYHELRLATARLQATHSEETLCQVTVDEVRRIIGYDRVMVYRFDADWNGGVVAEARDDQVTSSYLGMHFPASDIPEQARLLYTVNKLRCIPDANYKPAKLIAGTTAVRDRPLDMSQCVLRSVSPMHLEYLRNMGVGATMTVSLLKNGKLWGLIACHHYQPRQVCAERRLTCSFLAQVIEAQLNMREDGVERAYRVQTSAIQLRFLDQLAKASSLSGLANDPASVMDFVDAEGAAIVHGMKCILIGKTPEEASIPGLIDLITGLLQESVFASESLSAVYPPAEKFKDIASGMLAVEVSRERGDYILWFRPELLRTVNWAGNPDKPVSRENGTERLHPRKSFELWKKAVTRHSNPWKRCEIQAVIELGKTFNKVIAGDEELRARSRQKDAVTELGQKAFASTDTKVLFQDAVDIISKAMGIEVCRLFQDMPQRGGLLLRADVSPPDILEALTDSKAPADPLAAFAISSSTAVVVSDLRSESRFDGRPLYDLLGAVSGVAVLISDADANHGVITAYTHRSQRFAPADVNFLQAIAGILCTALRRKRLDENLEYQSQHDGLTGLPNRALFMERLVRAFRNIQAPPAILLIDLDRFKVVNDTLGHHFGDLLLQQVGTRFQNVLRTIDTLARLGGDEFVVLLPRTCEKDAIGVAQRILSELKTPFLLESISCEVGASIGIALAPRHGDDPNTLLRRADVAMYTAKRAGGGVTVYSADKDEYNPAQLDLMSDLRAAIEDGKLTMHYQPKMNLKTRKPEAVEALARWFHPRHGAIPPSRFIPMAEHAGLMGEMGRWAIEQAIFQHQQWCEKKLELGIAINLSPRVLHQKPLSDAVVDQFFQLKLPLDWLTLEITENTIIQDPNAAIEVLKRLRGEFGVRISVDDFGIGYSSLAYLKRLPLDEIKIDREFVKDMLTSQQDAAIAKTLIELGHNLGLKVVAEGVEDRETLELLTSLGCDQAQGYHISRPVPAEELVVWAFSSDIATNKSNAA